VKTRDGRVRFFLAKVADRKRVFADEGKKKSEAGRGNDDLCKER